MADTKSLFERLVGVYAIAAVGISHDNYQSNKS